MIPTIINKESNFVVVNLVNFVILSNYKIFYLLVFI